jgi:hypothetical protein
LTDLKAIPEDLENYVLKPLFSFRNRSYFSRKKEDIEVEKELYILQKKVNYIPIVQSPDGKVKQKSAYCAFGKEDAVLLYCAILYV